MAGVSTLLVATIERVNHRNAKGEDNRDVRDAINTLLESMLHDARAYAGFSYLSASEVPPGKLPGIVERADPQPGELKHDFPDDSRRYYFTHRKLRKG